MFITGETLQGIRSLRLQKLMGLSSTDNWLTARLGLSSSFLDHPLKLRPLQENPPIWFKKPSASVSFVSRYNLMSKNKKRWYYFPGLLISHLRTIFTGKVMGTMIYLNWFPFCSGFLPRLSVPTIHSGLAEWSTQGIAPHKNGSTGRLRYISEISQFSLGQ